MLHMTYEQHRIVTGGLEAETTFVATENKLL
jgi:hypothetical protein